VQRVNLDGVVYRHIKGAVRPKATLSLAVRRGESSAVLRQFVNFIRRAAKNFQEHGD
jgi:hypothetical protein